MIISDICLEKLKEFEGFRSEAYLDAAGVPTVGYGHTKNVKLGDKITEYCAKEYLLQDLYETEQAVTPPSGRMHDLSDAFAFVGFSGRRIR